jgi:hypothetical protein
LWSVSTNITRFSDSKGQDIRWTDLSADESNSTKATVTVAMLSKFQEGKHVSKAQAIGAIDFDDIISDLDPSSALPGLGMPDLVHEDTISPPNQYVYTPPDSPTMRYEGSLFHSPFL